jgi:hypothetical protein
LFIQARQGGLGGGGPDDDEQLLADKAEDLPEAEPAEPGDAPEHDHDEHGAGEVDAGHQLGEGGQRAEPILADGEGHGAERGDGRQPRDEGNYAEEHARHLVQQIGDRPGLLPEPGQGKAREQGEHEHGQDLAVHKGADEGVGDEVQQPVHRAELGGRLGVAGNRAGIERGHVGVEPGAGLEEVGHD